MSRPQATVRRVGRRPTANPKSEIEFWCVVSFASGFAERNDD
jgi:hypothetical protein